MEVVLITSPVTVKSKTGSVRRNQPGGTKSTQPPNACRQSMFRSPGHESVETPLIHSMNSESHSLKNSCLPTDEDPES